MQDARWTGEDRRGNSGFGSLGATLLRWARRAASLHAQGFAEDADSRGSCAADEGVTIAERMALLDESDRVVRARAWRLLFGGMR